MPKFIKGLLMYIGDNEMNDENCSKTPKNYLYKSHFLPPPIITTAPW